MRLPRKPQYVRVELDADMAESPPGGWPHGARTLTYHFLGKRKLQPGDRVCVDEGSYRDVFGTVLGRSWRYSGFTYSVRRARRRTIAIQVPSEIEVEVA